MVNLFKLYFNQYSDSFNLTFISFLNYPYVAETGHKKTHTNAMAEAGRKYIKDLVGEKKFKLRFHFHVVSDFDINSV